LMEVSDPRHLGGALNRSNLVEVAKERSNRPQAQQFIRKELLDSFYRVDDLKILESLRGDLRGERGMADLKSSEERNKTGERRKKLENVLSKGRRIEVERQRYGSQILDIVAGSAHALLTRPDIEEAVGRSLAILGNGAGVDRVYLFENHRDPETGEMLASQRFEWSRDGSASQKHNPLLINAPYRDFFLRWQRDLPAGRAIKGLVRNFPAGEREFLALQGILSLLVVPVRIEGRFWGFIGFDDCHEGKEWTQDEESILVAAAGNIVNAIERKRIEEALWKNEALYRNLFENASIGMFQATLEGGFLRLNKAYAMMLGYESPEELTATVTDAATQLHTDPEDHVRILAALELQDWFYAEQPYFRKDGSIMIGQLAVRKVVQEDGGIPFLEGIVENITERKRAEEALQKSEKALQIKARDLEEVNTALRVLLKTMEKDQEELKKSILTNIKEQILPYLEKIKKTPLNDIQKGYVRITETCLNEIASPFVRTLTSRYQQLTQKEIQVALLIKEGKTSKEIAELLHVSKRDVDFHRGKIREKIGLKNTRGSLQILLNTLDEQIPPGKGKPCRPVRKVSIDEQTPF